MLNTTPENTMSDNRSRGEKSREAFRTISEVADELGLAQHVLRFWESKFTQIKPLKRGGNRRYYRPQDVVVLRAIQALLHGEGYTIRGAQKLFREMGVKQTIEFALNDQGKVERLDEQYSTSTQQDEAASGLNNAAVDAVRGVSDMAPMAADVSAIADAGVSADAVDADLPPVIPQASDVNKKADPKALKSLLGELKSLRQEIS